MVGPDGVDAVVHAPMPVAQALVHIQFTPEPLKSPRTDATGLAEVRAVSPTPPSVETLARFGVRRCADTEKPEGSPVERG